jgi:hypothetical protein
VADNWTVGVSEKGLRRLDECPHLA